MSFVFISTPFGSLVKNNCAGSPNIRSTKRCWINYYSLFIAQNLNIRSTCSTSAGTPTLPEVETGYYPRYNISYTYLYAFIFKSSKLFHTALPCSQQDCWCPDKTVHSKRESTFQVWEQMNKYFTFLIPSIFLLIPSYLRVYG